LFRRDVHENLVFKIFFFLYFCLPFPYCVFFSLNSEPRGFAFVEYLEAYDASETQYHMNREIFGGREITVVLAAESRKCLEEMRRCTKVMVYMFLFLI
jgi:RNA recognition motif. (a.k.a. RRM, RBD, or RNP domain)